MMHPRAQFQKRRKLEALARGCVLSHFCCVQLFVTPWTVACQTPLTMGFSRQEYWSGLPFPPSGVLHSSGIKPSSSAAPALTGGFFTTEPPGKPRKSVGNMISWSCAVFLMKEKHNCLLVPAGDRMGESGWEGKVVKGQQNIAMWSKRTRSAKYRYVVKEN